MNHDHEGNKNYLHDNCERCFKLSNGSLNFKSSDFVCHISMLLFFTLSFSAYTFKTCYLKRFMTIFLLLCSSFFQYFMRNIGLCLLLLFGMDTLFS
jgi:hypothetical protein